MKSPERSNTKPSPQQMFGLARACIELGKQEKNSINRRKRPTPGVTFSSDFLAPPDQVYYDFIFDTPFSVSRRFIGKIGLVRDRAWAMYIKEVSSVFKGGERIDECYIIHRFKWSGGKVLDAMRQVDFVDMEEDFGPSYQPVYLDRTAFEPDLMHAVNQVQAVSAGDCEELLGEIRAFDESLRIQNDKLGIR